MKTERNDFVSVEFTGKSDGNVFDSNVKEDLKELDPKAEAKEMVVVIGQKMVVPGLDKGLEGKEIGKDYRIEVSAKEGFGERDRNLVKTIPLSVFTQHKIDPKPGAVLMMDQMLVKVITVSGARVVTDFNNPLAGKDLEYKFKIVKKVEDEKEKIGILFESILRMKPRFEIKDKEIVVEGPKGMKVVVEALSKRFEEILGMKLGFKEISEETSNSRLKYGASSKEMKEDNVGGRSEGRKEEQDKKESKKEEIVQ
jgi:FKBP-type peptidyl-prolyl cis-trans isomerase SlyD